MAISSAGERKMKMTTSEILQGYTSQPSTRAGKRVTPDGRTAPICRVRVRCPECRMSLVVDAYRGPASCRGGNPEMWYMFRVLWLEIWVQPVKPHPIVFMEPEELCT